MDDLRHRLDEIKAALRPGPPPMLPPRRPVPRQLIEIVGGEERPFANGCCWVIETPFERACEIHAVPADVFACERYHDAGYGDPLCIRPQQTLVVDIETGGFAGTPVFLIGVVPLDARPLRVIQFLARDYPEERAILHGLLEASAGRDTWVTFNGKSFDEPMLRDRATLHRLCLPRPRIHVDLLHAARRTWGRDLPNCRLGTLEAQVLGRPRVGDIPSSDVPELFHHFIRTGNAAPLRPVLLHNQIDLVSSTELLLRLTHP